MNLDITIAMLAKKLRMILGSYHFRLGRYFQRLLFPIYLFPIKLVTYSLYYLTKLLLRIGYSWLEVIVDTIIFPFKSLKNFLKSIAISIVFVYIWLSLVVIADYLNNQYGHIEKFWCAYGREAELKRKVVRIVGGDSEGSGFFVAPDKVLTNFHVIDYEPSPKVIMSDNEFLTPTRIIGNREADLAILYVPSQNSDLMIPIQGAKIRDNEPVYAAGYPLGTVLSGEATISQGRLIAYREQAGNQVGYIQTDISLVEGMSGGPLVDTCGSLVGVNTLSMAGLSLFIQATDLIDLIKSMNDEHVSQINVDPSKSPADAVYAFYTYLKARRMEDGFSLLSSQYLTKTDYVEWTNRFHDILDVIVYQSIPHEESEDIVFVKFSTKNWVLGEVFYRYYEGTWQTVFEDDVYKMNQSKIVEVTSPGWQWFYQ